MLDKITDSNNDNIRILKSGISIIDMTIFPILYTAFIVIPLWGLSTNNIYNWVIGLSLPFSSYMILSLFINRWYFLEDYIEVRYFFKPYNKTKRIYYSDIIEVKYQSNIPKREPRIDIITNKKSNNSINTPKSCVIRKFKDRKDILILLHNKGIPIKIGTVEKKDKEIVDLTNATIIGNKVW